MSEFHDVPDVDYLNEGADHDPEDIDEIENGDDLEPQMNHCDMAAKIIESVVVTDAECDEAVETEYDGSSVTDADDEDEEVTHPDAPNPPAPDD